MGPWKFPFVLSGSAHSFLGTGTLTWCDAGRNRRERLQVVSTAGSKVLLPSKQTLTVAVVEVSRGPAAHSYVLSRREWNILDLLSLSLLGIAAAVVHSVNTGISSPCRIALCIWLVERVIDRWVPSRFVFTCVGAQFGMPGPVLL